MTRPAPSQLTDEELFGSEVCAALDAFAAAAPPLDESQAALLQGLFAASASPRHAAA